MQQFARKYNLKTDIILLVLQLDSYVVLESSPNYKYVPSSTLIKLICLVPVVCLHREYHKKIVVNIL